MDEMLWVETLWNPLAEMKKSLMEDKESVIKVAAYCRVSESTSKEIDSLINQINHYTLSIYRRSNWKFVGIYYDKGRTGANYKNRIGFKRLIRHAKEGRIDYIITKSISRFSRNTKELIEIANGLKEINVGIYFEKENIDTLIGNTDLLLSLYGAINQQEIEDISNVTRWGYEKRFIKGIPKFSKFLGYEVIDNQGNPEVKIIESEARVVQTIFDMYLNGSSQAGIARYLMQNDIKTTRGNTLWTSNNVRHILTNIAYSGDKLARAKTKNIFTNVVTSSDEIRTQYLIENSHPPIISKETFARTQELLKNRSNLNKKAQQGPFIKRAFSGRLTCGLCGRKYHSGRSRGINYWRCRTNRVSSQLCKSKFFSDKKLKEMIIIAFQRRFDFNSSEILITLLKIIEKINQNDYFEFHRLKYLTEIEIEKENNQRLEKLQDEYKNFEIRIQKIEEDRQYRDAAISWIKGISSTNEFIDAISIEHTRAWVMEITAYSENDFIVQWIDDITTEIGDCNSFKVEDKVFENGALDDNELTFKPIEGRDDNLNKAVKMSVPKAQSSVLSNIKNKYKNSEIEVIYKEVPKRESKLRVASYCRISTELGKQRNSLKTQIGFYTFLILRNPEWEFAGIYAENGISGTSTKNRTEFNRLMDDCKAGKIDMIITKSISRFARNTVDCLETIRMLKSLENPVYVFFEKENISSKDEKSELLISVYSSLAQEESTGLAYAVAWGKRKAVERGIVKPSVYYYGYEFDKDKNWIINEEQAANVRRIYNECINGKSYNSISHGLERDGIKSPRGKDIWSGSTIRDILKNEVYRGNYLYQKTYIKDTLERKSKINNGELPMYFIENHHEPIIDNDTWEKVQNVLKEKICKNMNLEKYESVFFHKFKCGKCEGTISHINKDIRNESVHYWTCLSTKNYNKCGMQYFRQEYVEYNFIKMIEEIRKNKKFRLEVEDLISKVDLNSEELASEINMQKEIEQLNQELYITVDEELTKKGKDSIKVDKLTEEIVTRIDIIKNYRERKEGAARIKEELNWILNDLKDKKFNDETFNRLIESGVIFLDGRIVYKLNIGIEWSVDLNYDEYLEKKKNEEEELKKEDFFKSEEVKRIIEYCKEPKSAREINDYSRQYKSCACIRQFVIKPLLEKGILKRTIPDKPTSVNQKYYSVIK